jgi:hypothetical protein
MCSRCEMRGMYSRCEMYSGGRRSLGMIKRRRNTRIAKGGMHHCKRSGKNNCVKNKPKHVSSPVLAKLVNTTWTDKGRHFYETLHSAGCEVSAQPSMQVAHWNRRKCALDLTTRVFDSSFGCRFRF